MRRNIINLQDKKDELDEKLYIDFCNTNFGEEHITTNIALQSIIFLQRLILEYLMQILWATLPDKIFKEKVGYIRNLVNIECDKWVLNEQKGGSDV